MEEGSAAEDFVVGFLSLPTEILQIIIEYLPIKSVVRLSIVCKIFQVLAEDANLWKSRLKRLLKTSELAPENVPLVPSPAGWKYQYVSMFASPHLMLMWLTCNEFAAVSRSI